MANAGDERIAKNYESCRDSVPGRQRNGGAHGGHYSLEAEGFHLESCGDGAAALEKIESHEHYELFILDHELPGITGLELLLRARRLAHRRRTPIMMFTASECETEARAGGADAFLAKPTGASKLVETARRLMFLDERMEP